MSKYYEKSDDEQKAFDEYRKQVHPDEYAEERKENMPNKMVRIAFGIFMVVIYIGMGIMLMMNAFDWDDKFTWIRWLIGVVLVIYGIWRGYRQYKGIDYRY